MRFLHTADWHIGKPLRGRTRFDEYAAALDEIVGIARESRVDAVLLAGESNTSPASSTASTRDSRAIPTISSSAAAYLSLIHI